MANVDGFRYSFVTTYGLLITYGFEGNWVPKYSYLQKSLQVTNVDRFGYTFVMTYGLLITYGFEGE